MPAESGEKMTLGISSILGAIIFLMEMSNYIPPTDIIPLIGQYYGVCLGLITINICLSVLILNVNIAGERKKTIPPVIK